MLDWWKIRIEPISLPQRSASADLLGYSLCLPLISDGRFSLPLYRTDPALATIQRCPAEGPGELGTIELRDNQLTCVWPDLAKLQPEQIRITAPRFLVDDPVVLRPSGGTIGLFKVAALEALGPDPVAAVRQSC
ncbi:MAG: hypothetical protein RL339_2119 [Pseudomonadota bacterium]